MVFYHEYTLQLVPLVQVGYGKYPQLHLSSLFNLTDGFTVAQRIASPTVGTSTLSYICGMCKRWLTASVVKVRSSNQKLGQI